MEIMTLSVQPYIHWNYCHIWDLSLWVQEVVPLILNTPLNEDKYFSILLDLRYEDIFFQTHSTAQFNA